MYLCPQALNDDKFALNLLKSSLVAGSRPAMAAIMGCPVECVYAFRQGLRSCLNKVLAIKVRSCAAGSRRGGRA